MGWFDNILRNLKKAEEKEIVFDTGRRVLLGKLIAEGGFSFVYDAKELLDNNNKKKSQPAKEFVVKQIQCGNEKNPNILHDDDDDERLQSCYREAKVHLSFNEREHPNIMPLLGFNILREETTTGGGGLDETTTVCYMLFPKMARSLREEVNYRVFDDPMQKIQRENRLPPIMPWEHELTALQIFHGVVRGVYHLHQRNYSHRDVKLENILFDATNVNKIIPKITDFGSCGNLIEPIPDKKRLNDLIDQAATNTTMSYRPPELFSGGIIITNHQTNYFQDDDAIIDYTKVDVWSLGCLLFGILFGSSPFECEFRHHTNGQIHIVDCSQTRILSKIPQPPDHCVVNDWYSNDTTRLIRSLLNTNRSQRPCMEQLITQLEQIIPRLGGNVIQPIPIDREKLNRIEMQQQQQPHHHALLNNSENFDFNASFSGLQSSSSSSSSSPTTTTPQPNDQEQINAMEQAAAEEEEQEQEKVNDNYTTNFQDSFSSFQGA